jgi:hypothetical protein
MWQIPSEAETEALRRAFGQLLEGYFEQRHVMSPDVADAVDSFEYSLSFDALVELAEIIERAKAFLPSIRDIWKESL